MKASHSVLKAYLIISLVAGLLFSACQSNPDSHILIDEDFSEMPHGPLAYDVGAYTEYHYLPEAGPKTPWVVSTFRYNLPPSWEVRQSGTQHQLIQTAYNPNNHWHPIVITGSPYWTDYTIDFSF